MHAANQEAAERTAEILKAAGYEVAEDLSVMAPVGTVSEVLATQRASLQLELLWDISTLLEAIANKD